MIRQYINVARGAWHIIIYYNVSYDMYEDIYQDLYDADCPRADMLKVKQVLKKKNTGFTFTNTERKLSIVCISKATSKSQFFNTAIHEIDHVQSHICTYYGVGMKTEEAAYLIGYIVRKMHSVLKFYV